MLQLRNLTLRKFAPVQSPVVQYQSFHGVWGYTIGSKTRLHQTKPNKILGVLDSRLDMNENL